VTKTNSDLGIKQARENGRDLLSPKGDKTSAGEPIGSLADTLYDARPTVMSLLSTKLPDYMKMATVY
jgi:hypothetical protein